jgi:uroporphyrinogen-III synthase
MTDNQHALIGIRVLVGRASHQASTLSAGLKALGADVIEVPFIEIRPPRSYRPFDSGLNRVSEYDWLVLTSVNGVRALTARMKQLQLSLEHLAHLKIAAIGPATRSAVEQLGLKVAVVPAQYIAESVVESLHGKVDDQRVLLARARVARDVIPRELRKMGAKVDVLEAYETIVPLSSKERLRLVIKDPKLRPHVVTFTSSSTVRNFVALLGSRRRSSLDNVQFASIGPVTSATLREFRLPVYVEAREYTIPGLIKAIANSVRR